MPGTDWTARYDRLRRVPAWLPPWYVAGAVLALFLANAWFTAWTIAELILLPDPVDWNLATEAGQRLVGGRNPYGFGGETPFLWSPAAAWLIHHLEFVGPTIWRILHFGAVLLLLPNRRLVVICLISWPFWFDVATGNLMTFVFVAAVSAMRGYHVGGIAFLALAMLVPRPLMIPTGAWLLWKQPVLRLWFAAVLAAHAIAVLVTGWGGEWIGRVTDTTPQLVGIPFDVSPSRFIGEWWPPIGLALAIWLLRSGRPGLASLAISPYWLPYYLFMPLAELDRAARVENQREALRPLKDSPLH